MSSRRPHRARLGHFPSPNWPEDEGEAAGPGRKAGRGLTRAAFCPRPVQEPERRSPPRRVLHLVPLRAGSEIGAPSSGGQRAHLRLAEFSPPLGEGERPAPSTCLGLFPRRGRRKPRSSRPDSGIFPGCDPHDATDRGYRSRLISGTSPAFILVAERRSMTGFGQAHCAPATDPDADGR